MMTWYHPHQVARRAAAGRFVIWAIFAVLLLAFFRVQILSSERYQLQSESNRLRPVPTPAPRGLIVDRNGVVLAENVPGYSIGLLASSPESLLATIGRLRPIVRVDSAEVTRVLRRYRRNPSEPVVVVRDAPFDVVSALEERRIWLPGLVVQSEPKRRYPYGEATAHLIGYVGEITEEELQSDRYPNARLGTLIGRDGVESAYDRRLRGRDGFKFVEVDALGRTVRDAREESTLDPEPGETIRTTIDIELQQFIAEIFPEGRRGAVVAMDPVSGEVLALYSSPTYDPNEFIGGVDPHRWRELSTASDFPLLNRAIQARYPPASPWKLVVAAMALQRGIVSMDSRMQIPCRGGLQYYNRYFRCWKVQGHGDLTLAEAIQHSCDVYFYQLGLKIQLNNLLHDGVAMGFRERSGIDLPDEYRPIYPASTEYFNRLYGPRGWTNAVTLNLAIGQGENSQTLINMTRFYAALANRRGVVPEPRVVRTGDVAEVRSLGLAGSDLDGLRHALVQAVDRGTAAGARIASLRIAGKTGTAQNAHGPDHGWFIGFAPEEDPQIVVGAIVEFSEHGSAVARIVTPIISRYLEGPTAPAVRTVDVRFIAPSDSAPQPVPILPDTAALFPSPVDSLGGGTARRR